MTSWFRFHTAALNNSKVQRLKPALFKSWVNLLCIAADNGGKLPPSVNAIAFALRIRPSTAKVIVNDLMSAELIDKDGQGFRPHDWNDWQFQSDVSTERVKRFRERRNGVSETAVKPQGNVAETPSDSEQSRADSDSEAETFQTRSPGGSARSAPGTRPGTNGTGGAHPPGIRSAAGDAFLEGVAERARKRQAEAQPPAPKAEPAAPAAAAEPPPAASAVASISGATGPDWTDPANRKAAWETAAFNTVKRALPEAEAVALIADYLDGKAEAKRLVERLVRRARRKPA